MRTRKQVRQKPAQPVPSLVPGLTGIPAIKNSLDFSHFKCNRLFQAPLLRHWLEGCGCVWYLTAAHMCRALTGGSIPINANKAKHHGREITLELSNRNIRIETILLKYHEGTAG